MERTTVTFASILIKASTHSGCDVYHAVNVAHTFIFPGNALELRQFLITNHGYANSRVFSKYTNEDCPTKWFSIPQILDDNIALLLNSS